MKVTVAKEAGFCFGVKRATEFVEHSLGGDADIYVLGNLIHNRPYNEHLAARGVRVIGVEEAEAVAARGRKACIVIRTHGVPREDEEKLRALEAKYPNLRVEDMTCPFVKKIHRIAAEHTAADVTLFVLGDPTHPEVLSILSYAKGETVVFDSEAELEKLLAAEKHPEKPIVLVAQTTQNTILWKKCEKKLKKLYTNAIIFDTICSVTENRQNEVKQMASRADVMCVIGGAKSSNTRKLYEIASLSSPNVYLLEKAADVPEEDFKLLAGASKNAGRTFTVGITAGASTPDDIIEEVKVRIDGILQKLSD